MRPMPDELAGHPDRVRWNARYSGRPAQQFDAHPLAEHALSVRLPAGPVLDLACGPSGSALLAAGKGRRVTAVDLSDVALGMLSREAQRRGLSELITLVLADLAVWRPPPRGYAFVLCARYWDRTLFPAAADAVAAGGLLGWEAFTDDARQAKPGLAADWCLRPGEPVSLLPAGFGVISCLDLPNDERGTKRRLLARRLARAVP